LAKIQKKAVIENGFLFPDFQFQARNAVEMSQVACDEREVVVDGDAGDLHIHIIQFPPLPFQKSPDSGVSLIRILERKLPESLFQPLDLF
jgi:hypothetical protein